MSADSSDLIRVFFYGTLKRNQPNAEHLLNKNVTFVSDAVTKDKWPLIVASDCNVPFLIYHKGVGKVCVQCY
jgi:gamma-glutamylaminecyclotransferase